MRFTKKQGGGISWVNGRWWENGFGSLLSGRIVGSELWGRANNTLDCRPRFHIMHVARLFPGQD
jgi:hypothetical protein